MRFAPHGCEFQNDSMRASVDTAQRYNTAPRDYRHRRISSPTILSDALPSQYSIVHLACLRGAASMVSIVDAAATRSSPTRRFVPWVMVTGRSVLERKVMQGTP